MENCFDDKCMATDLLNSEKMMTSQYNTALCESATGEVRGCLSGILDDEHRIQQEIFDVMSSKGWYPTPKAEETKLNEARVKFENTKANMN